MSDEHKAYQFGLYVDQRGHVVERVARRNTIYGACHGCIYDESTCEKYRPVVDGVVGRCAGRHGVRRFVEVESE